MGKLLGVLFVLAFAAIIIVAACLLDGVVISYLWGWFVVPIFGVSELTIMQALGLGLTTGYMCKYRAYTKSKDDDDEYAEYKRLAYLIAFPLFAWFFGWVIHSFMG